MRLRFLLGIALLVVFGASQSRGQSYWYSPSGNWSTSADWYLSAPANNGTASLIFNYSGIVTSTVDTSYSIYSLALTGATGTLTIGSSGGSTLTISGAGSISYGDTENVYLNVPIQGAGSLLLNGGTGILTLNPGAGANTYSGNTQVYAGGTLTDGEPNSFSASSLLYVGGSPHGTVKTYYNETVAGLADVIGGQGYINLVNPGTTLFLNSSLTTSFSGIIQGSGNLEKDGTSTQILSGANTYTGTTTIGSGATIQLGDGSANTGSLATSQITGAGGLSLYEPSLSTTTISAPITGTLSVADNGSGTVTLAGTNTYTGATTINSGTLQAGSTHAFGNSTQTLAINGGELDLNGFSNSVAAVSSNTSGVISLTSGATLTLTNAAASTTIAGPIDGSGTLVTEQYQLSLTSNGNMYTGGTTIASGTLIADNSNPGDYATGTGPITIEPGGALLIGQNNTSGYISPSSAITNNGQFQFVRTDGTTSSPVVIANTITGTGGVYQYGSGVIELSGTNTYSGITEVYTGGLEAGSTSAFGGATGKSQIQFPYDGSLYLNGYNNTVGSISATAGVGSLNLGANTLTLNDTTQDTTFSIPIIGTGGSMVFGQGGIILTGNSTYTGGTSITYGYVLVANSTGYGLGTGPISISNGATLDIGANSTTGFLSTAAITDNGTINFNRSDVATYPNMISGTGSITVNVGGVILTGANTYSGLSTFAGGASILDNATGSATGTGLVAVGSGASLQIGENDAKGSVGSGITINDEGTLIFDRSDSPTSDITLTGSGGLSMIGSGNVTLFQNNTYSGPTTIQNGQFTAGSATAFGNGLSNLTLTNNGRLNMTGYNLAFGSLSGDASAVISTGGGILTTGGNSLNTTYAGVLTGTGGLSILGEATQVLTGANTYTGPTNIANGATLEVGDGSTTGASIVSSVSNSGTLEFAPAATDTITYSGSITGTGELWLNGSGTIVLSQSGGNTYYGETKFDGGTLSDGAANAYSPNSSFSIEPSATLLVNFNETIGDLENGCSGGGPVVIASGKTLTIGVGNGGADPYLGTISGGGGIAINTGGPSQGFGGANTYSGGTTMQTGEIFVSSSTVGAPGSITSGPLGTGTLLFTGNGELSSIGSNVTLANAINLNSYNLDNDDATTNLTLSGPISGYYGSITWCTNNVLALMNTNSFTGGVDMREGTLLLGSDTGAGVGGTITLDYDTTLDAAGTGMVRTIANPINISSSETTFGTNNNNSLTLTGPIYGSYTSIVVETGPAGSLTLANNNSSSLNADQFDVISGTLIVANNGALGSSGATVYLDGGAGLIVNSGVTVSNPIATLVSPNTIGGSGTISSPAIIADGTVILSPTAAPGGGPGNLTFTNALTLASGVAIHFDLYNATGAAGTGYGLITANGGLNLTASPGTITFNLLSTNSTGASAAALNFNPALSYSWTFASSSTAITGFNPNQFNLVSSFLNSTNGGTFSFSESGNNLELNFTPVPEPSTWALLAAGVLVAVPLAVRRRRRARA